MPSCLLYFSVLGGIYRNRKFGQVKGKGSIMEGRVLFSFVFFVALFILNSVIVWVLVKFLLLFMKIPKTLIKLSGYFCSGSALLITNNNSHCLCQHNCSSNAQNFTLLPLFTSHRNNNTIHFNLSYSHIKKC